MKHIHAIIQPFRLAKVRDALRGLPGFPGMTVQRIQGFSQIDGAELPRDIKGELTDYSPGIRLGIIAPDDLVPEIVRRIHAGAHTGQKGDGILWVTPVESFMRLREPPAKG
ncbi:MAG: P-II family nitrogen regulator [Burkholderiales bacterium]|jgi:nitrogen regulatory protein P-II 1|nr:P-II family nitrogen regulator [Burkholderiales bacterium]